MSDHQEQKGSQPQPDSRNVQVPGQPPLNPPSSQPYQPGFSPQGSSAPAGMPPSGQVGQQPESGAPFQGQSGPGVPPQGQPYQQPPQGTPPQGQPSWQPYSYSPKPVKNHQTSSTVLGILSIFASLLSPMLAFILGGIGLAFSSQDRKNFGPQASRVGRICSIVGIVLGLITWIASVAFLLANPDSVSLLSGLTTGSGSGSSSSSVF